MSEATKGEVRTVKSADRTVVLLETLAARQPITMAALAHALEMPRSSLHGILRTLEARGWVEEEPGTQRFRLGLRAALVGNTYVEQDDVIRATSSRLDWLNQETGETAQLARLTGVEIVYLAKRQSQHPVTLVSPIGGRRLAHVTALGKALLSTRSDSELDNMLAFPLQAMTPRSLTTRDMLYADLGLARDRGYACEEGENAEHLYCFAIPLPWNNPATDAISVSVPAYRVTDQLRAHIIDVLLQIHSEMRGD